MQHQRIIYYMSILNTKSALNKFPTIKTFCWRVNQTASTSQNEYVQGYCERKIRSQAFIFNKQNLITIEDSVFVVLKFIWKIENFRIINKSAIGIQIGNTHCVNRSNLVILFWWKSPSWAQTSLKLPNCTSYLSSSRMLLAWMSLQEYKKSKKSLYMGRLEGQNRDNRQFINIEVLLHFFFQWLITCYHKDLKLYKYIKLSLKRRLSTERTGIGVDPKYVTKQW